MSKAKRTSNDFKISCLLRLAELCGTGEEEKKKYYMGEVEKLLFSTNPDVNYKFLSNEEDEHVRNFGEEFGVDNLVNIPVSEVFYQYVDWCEQNEYIASSSVAFGRRFCKIFGLMSQVRKDANNSSYRIYRFN